MAAPLFTSPFIQFLNPSGVPYAGAQLFFYASGTTTPQPVYADQYISTELSNPVVADSAGYFPAIFMGTQPYKVVLEDASGNQLYTQDPWDVGGTSFSSNVVTTSSGSIGFSAINTSANGHNWGWYSNPDGSFTCYDATANFSYIYISITGITNFFENVDISSPNDVGISLINTSPSGQNWGFYSNTDGSLSLFNATTTENFLKVSASGQAIFYNGGSIVVQGTTLIGVSCVNQGTNGRNWGWYSKPDGSFVCFDAIANLAYATFLGGVLTLSGTMTASGSYGYLNNTGAGTTTGSYAYGLSVPAGVVAGSFTATSDARAKTDVAEIDAAEAWRYVLAARPVTFKMGGAIGAGFIAQDEVRNGRGASVGLVDDAMMTETREPDGFVSPAGARLVKNYDHDIAYLTRAVQDLRALLDEALVKIAELKPLG